MSVSIQKSTLSERQSTALKHTKSNFYPECMSLIKNGEGDTNGQKKVTESKSATPNLRVMSLSIVFCDSKRVAIKKIKESTKLSPGLTRPNAAVQKTPVCAKLPHKAQSYNSESFLPLDQEDNSLSDSAKLKSSPLGQNLNTTRPILIRHARPPNNDAFRYKYTSKTTIVDKNWSRSENFSSHPVFNIPLNNENSFRRDVHRCQSYGALCQPKQIVIIDLSPEAQLLSDISNFEFDNLAPDRGLYALEHSKSSYIMRRVNPLSRSTDFLYPKFSPTVEALFIYDDVDRQSNNSSTDTYSIANDNYIEEQNARMSVDFTFEGNSVDDSIEDSLKQRSLSKEGDQELIFEFSDHVILQEPKKDISIRSPLSSNTTLNLTRYKDNNIVDILSCYEFSTDPETTLSLEKLNFTPRGISQKIIGKPPPEFNFASEYCKYLSVTTSRVMSSDNLRAHWNLPVRKRCYPVKSETDQTDYLYSKYSRNREHIWIQDRGKSKKTFKLSPTISNTTYIVE